MTGLCQLPSDTLLETLPQKIEPHTSVIESKNLTRESPPLKKCFNNVAKAPRWGAFIGGGVIFI